MIFCKDCRPNSPVDCLDYAELEKANFTGTKFVNVSLYNAKAKKAIFTNVEFRRCDLRGLSFDNSTNFRGAKYDRNTKLPFSEAVARSKGMRKISH